MPSQICVRARIYTYRRILRSMYAGEIGSALVGAFRRFNVDVEDSAIGSLPLEHLQFYSKMREQGSADGKFFNTCEYDGQQSTKSMRNMKCTPRVGSYALVSGYCSREILIRIMVLFFVSQFPIPIVIYLFFCFAIDRH